jgi:competence protein ComEC
MGILAAIHLEVTAYSYYFLAFLLVVYIVCWLVLPAAVRRKKPEILGFAGMGMLFCAGQVLVSQRNDLQNPIHLQHLPDTITNTITHYRAIIDDDVEKQEKSKRTVVRLTHVKTLAGWQAVSGNILVYIAQKDTTFLNYGDIVLIRSNPKKVSPPANPGQFDYRRYLSYKHIFHQDYWQQATFKVIGQKVPNPLFAVSLKIRKYADSQLRRYITAQREYGVASALLLGVKTELDDDIKQAYSGAGAMHVLAVSGLHVGILFSIIMFILSPIQKTKIGKLVSPFLAIALLWLYAFITGLSPSVMRAVTMCSLVIIARAISRNTNIYNILSLSAFILLIYDPFLLMQVGFQLSYLAVLGIVYFQPIFYRWFAFENKIADYVWQLTCVSLAAQLVTFPISVYYFHQFPTYFFVSNLLVIPAAGIILNGGLLLLFLSWIEFLAQYIGILLEYFIFCVNQGVFFINDLYGAVIQPLSISLYETLFLYAFIFFMAALFAARKIIYLYMAFLFAFSYGISGIYQAYLQSKQSQFIVYDVAKHTQLSFINGSSVVFYPDTLRFFKPKLFRNNIEEHFLQAGTSFSFIAPSEKNLAMSDWEYGKIFVWNGQKILLLNKKPKKDPTKHPIKVNYLLLTNNAVRYLNQINHITFDKLIIDGSNHFNTIQQLSAQLKKTDKEFYIVGGNEAFTFSR